MVIRAWLQLIRVPNLFTVPGDPIAGFMMANQNFMDWSLLWVACASLCLYAAGLIDNDLADQEEDLRERPNRPLPSGAVPRKQAIVAQWCLNAAGLVCLALTRSQAALILGVTLIVAVLLYNRVTKHIPVVGALNMGLCRALSVFIGSVVGPMHTYELAKIPAIITLLYIAAITNLARFETGSRVPRVPALLPFPVFLLGATAGSLFALVRPSAAGAIAIFAVGVGMAGWITYDLLAGRKPLPPTIGSFIRCLLFLQAAVCYAGSPDEGGRVAAIALLALYPISKRVSRTFYAS